MTTTSCKHEKTKSNHFIDEAGDIEQTVCAAEDCGFVLNEVVVVERPDGTTIKRPRRVNASAQPESFQFRDKDGGMQQPEEGMVSAQDMMALAIKTRDETVGKQGRELAKTILKECAEKVLEGEHAHLVAEGEEIPGEIVALGVKELKSLGYKVKKTPEPGVGAWIHVKWPTTNRKPRKKKETKEEEPEIKIGRKKKLKASQADKETQQRQQSAAKRRQEALKVRSDSPS